MAYTVIDRRLNGKGKSASNRQKFIRRVKKQVKNAVKEAIRDGNISDIVNSDGKKINVPVKDLSQPTFHHDKEGGSTERVYPGNKEFSQGDRVSRPPQGGDGGGGREGAPEGEGADEFQFNLTKEEFLDIFFEDLELPDMIKKQLTKVVEYENRRAGYSIDGNPSRLNVLRTMKQAKGRRFGLRSPKKKKLRELEQERDNLITLISQIESNNGIATIEKDKLVEVLHQIEVIKRKIKAVPFIDEMDLRFNRWEKFPLPTTQAVMFCIMDVSGSMGEWEKEMSKRFFMLLYLFLVHNYERVDLVFIRHHIQAKEVEEEEFFYSKESGGTMVSPAFELMMEIAEERYPRNQWNVYACQCSDGDNWLGDNPNTVEILKSKVIPLVQYLAYVEIDRSERTNSDLWPEYESLMNQHENFNMSRVTDAKDIYPVFRKLFEKRKH